VDFVVLVRDRSSIDDKNRNPLRETHGDVIAAVLHFLLHTLEGPAGIVAHNWVLTVPGAERVQARDPRIALWGRKQRARWNCLSPEK
jgi:hypothetical protein